MVQNDVFPEHVQAPPKQQNQYSHGMRQQTDSLQSSAKELATRLKILEERYSTLRKKTQVTEQSLIESDKNQFEDIHVLSEKIVDLKKTIRDMSEKLTLLSDEIEGFADKNEFLTLQRYVEFWNPMDFVTRKKVNDFLRKKFHPK